MLDSGTTYTYLRPDAFNLLSRQFDEACRQKSTLGYALCGQKPAYEKGYCVTYDATHYKSLDNFFNSFPKLYFKLSGTANIIWFAKDYLTKSDQSNDSNLVFCSSIQVHRVNQTSSTLGSSFFRHYDIYFDRDNKNVSFVRSECDDKSSRSYPILGIRDLVSTARVL